MMMQKGKMMRFAMLLATVLAVASFADAQVTVVHPNQYENIEGPQENSWPYRFTALAGHYQQSFEAAQFSGPITITEVSYRHLDDDFRTARTADFKMRLAYCANPWNALSLTFADNIGANSTVVFDGEWDLPEFSGHPDVPNPFTQRIVLTTPFTYDPTQGDLLLDIEMRHSVHIINTDYAGHFERSNLNKGTARVYANSGDPYSLTADKFKADGLITEFTGSLDLEADLYEIPESTGGTVHFTLDAGVDNANRNYLLLGGLTGTSPGTLLPGGYATLPINWDDFTEYVVLPNLNTPLFMNFLGTLDGNGQALAQLNAPPVPGFAGIIMHYAYCCNNPFDFVSNPLKIEIVP